MKAIVIGGGIAGLASAICLRRSGIEAVVYERTFNFARNGLGFLMLPNGLQALDSLGLGKEARMLGKPIHRIEIRNTQGEVIREDRLFGFFGIPRFEIVELLRSKLPGSAIVTGQNFRKFERSERGHYLAATFQSGVSAEADIFVGADGIHSRTRTNLYPGRELISVREKEIVCMVKCPQFAAQLGNSFIKIRNESGGLNVGIVPAGGDKVIWFIQFDAEKFFVPESTPESLFEFTNWLIGAWPDPIPRLLAATDFSSVHLWNMKTLELLPSFSNENCVLVGDAAHPLLAFTSQGANSALQDGIVLGDCFAPGKAKNDARRIPRAFAEFNHRRLGNIADYIDQGNYLLHQFLAPKNQLEDRALPFAAALVK